MAKSLYTAAEAAEKLGCSEEKLKGLVRDGKLREFRDAGSVNYRTEDIEGLASELNDSGSDTAAGASGEIVLEPVDDSSVELASGRSDIFSMDEIESEDTTAGTKGGTALERKKGDSAIPSVGVNVFDDDELDEHVDPLAQTAVTDIAGLGVDAVSSGSGILDLARESDDTSLGKELLDEIYTDDQEGAVEMGEDTRAGLDEAIPAGEAEGPDAEFPPPDEEVVASAPARTQALAVEYAQDAWSTSLTALLAVATVVLWFGGIAAIAAARGALPGLLDWVYFHMAACAGGALLVAGLAAGVTFFLAKRRP